MDGAGFPLWYTMVWCGWFGALTASFLCVVAERVPRGQSIGGRSKCACGRQLKVSENIPIIGWLRVKGTARCCGAALPPFYLLAELFLTAAWGVAPALGRWAGAVVAVISAAALVAVGVRRLNVSAGASSRANGHNDEVH